MEMTNDLVVCFDNDLALIIMGLLNVIDVIRAAAVSKAWRRFVIANGLCEKIFSRLFPGIARIVYEVEGTYQLLPLARVLDVEANWGGLERDHRLYSSLLQPLAIPMYQPRDCVSYPIFASSSHGFYGKYENTLNTMNPVDESFWSSEGQVDPDVPEYITYKLCSSMCIVTAVDIRPYKASPEPENPVYAPTSVRFRFGYSRSLNDLEIPHNPLKHAELDEYIWTYTSPEFPMTQEAVLQRFKLPEPIVCVGGVVCIEMLGRAQMDPSDGLFYVSLGYVEIVGQSLHPAYVLHILKNGVLQLRFYRRVLDRVLRNFPRDPIDLGQMLKR